MSVALVREVQSAGATTGSLSYRSLRTLAEIDAAVAKCTGFARYRIDCDPDDQLGSSASITLVDRGGVALGLQSRTDRDHRLRGTKHRSVVNREVIVARGGSDGRTVVLVPEVKHNQVIGLTLLHVALHENLAVPVARRVLAGYSNRLTAISDAVTETVPVFDETILSRVPTVDLLTEPVAVLADRWWRRPR
jgi:glucosamine--fructose-6-phosphate aminotransferase (isomerizing)